MNNRAKNIIYSLLVIVAVFAIMKFRQNKTFEAIKIEGATMGTTYHVTYFDLKERNFKREIDSILLLVNKSINTYDSSSEISRFNRSTHGLRFELPYFLPPLKISQSVVAGSLGAYDPTVMPLVNAWGFGPQKIVKPDTGVIEAVRSFVGFEKISFNSDSVWKSDPRVQLDFGGIGQGYGADVITDFLKGKGITSMLVELGGEGMAVGINEESKKPWELGLVNPSDPKTFIGYISLKDKSFSTSGNYFNYKEVDGIRYSHTIDPIKGYPAERPILSASVFARDCSTADAWATAFMVMGHEKAIQILKSHPELDVCLIYSSSEGVKTFLTDKIAPFISLQN